MNIVWLLVLVILTGIVFGQVSAYKLKPVMLGSPDGFTCHPSWSYFTSDTMAANLTAEQTKGDAPFTVQFYDTSYGYPETWSWDFGDGNTSEEQYPIHTYLVPGTYDVSLTIGKAVSYETTMVDYNQTGKGQFTDISGTSTDRRLNYITVAPEGSGTNQPTDPAFFPEEKKTVIMPSGDTGVIGSAQFSASTITMTPDTQKGYTDTLNIDGAYRLSKFTPYNDAF
jgi:PKD repeat protein